MPSQPPPLSEVPSSLAENTSSRLRDTPSDSPGVQLNESLLHSVNNSPDEETSHQSFQSARTTGDSSVGAGFNSSQRVIRNGMEVVISSDGDETDSIASLEDVDELLKMFTNPKPKDNASEKPPNSSSTNTHTGLQSSHRMPLRTSPTKQNKFNPSDYTVPKYENTLDMLVAEAVDDNETEADVAKLKAAFEAEDSQNHGETKSDSRGGLHEDMLTSALGDKDDELGLQRLLDAVRRTEVFEQEKSWLFFDDKSNTPPIREFPREAVVPGAYLAGLRG